MEASRILRQELAKHPDQADPMMRLYSAAYAIARIADHATNICEDVIYMVEGEIIRHKPAEEQESAQG